MQIPSTPGTKVGFGHERSCSPTTSRYLRAKAQADVRSNIKLSSFKSESIKKRENKVKEMKTILLTLKRVDGSEETKESTFMPKNYYDLQCAFAMRFPKEKSLMVIQHASNNKILNPTLRRKPFQIGERIVFREFQDMENYENFKRFIDSYNNRNVDSEGSQVKDNIVFEEEYREKIFLRKTASWKI